MGYAIPGNMPDDNINRAKYSSKYRVSTDSLRNRSFMSFKSIPSHVLFLKRVLRGWETKCSQTGPNCIDLLLR